MIEIATSEEDALITQEDVQKSIERFLTSTKVTNTVKRVLSQTIVLRGSTIELNITNPVEKSMIQNNEVEIMKFLRKDLQNTSIHFDYYLSKDSSERRPYTSIEIFKAMAKKNPDLLKLREVLSLDTES